MTVPAERTVEPLRDRAGQEVGRVVRESRAVPFALRLDAEPAGAPFRLHRVRGRQ